MSTIGFPEGPGELVSEDGRWRWDGQRWNRVAEPDALPPRPPAPDALPPRRPAPNWEPAIRETPPPAHGPVEPLDASAFTGDRMLKGRAVAPSRGWRRSVYAVSGGLVNPGLSQTEQAERALAARSKAPIAGCRRVVIVARKGGIGKTTTTISLGHTFASLRGDRVIALDANPDAGSLADRIDRQTSSTVTDVLRDVGRLDRYSDIRAHTSQAPSRLEVIASDNDPAITTALGERDYRTVLNVLDRHYNLILVDTGTGVLSEANQAALNAADQLVLCAGSSLDKARVAAMTIDWLEEHGYEWLASQAVVVINEFSTERDGRVDIALIARHFSYRCRAVQIVPWDPHLATGAVVRLEEMAPATKRAYLELAALVADGFGTRPPTAL
jgi:putative peptide zinc metalloprotease protein